MFCKNAIFAQRQAICRELRGVRILLSVLSTMFVKDEHIAICEANNIALHSNISRAKGAYRVSEANHPARRRNTFTKG